jgi:hypothetical protein
MKHVFLKSALMSFAMVAAVTVSAQHSTPDASPQSTVADRAMVDRSGNPRSRRAQWVYRIVAKWGPHVQEAYRTDPRRWAESMGQVFAKASPDALQRAAEARTFAAMNDALLALSSPAGMSAPRSASGAKALGDPDRDLVYVPVTPCRILDTRVVGGPIPANSFRDFDLTDVIRFAPQGGDTSNCNVGDKGSFAAAAINFTVVSPNIAGYITAFPYLASQPTAATINYVAGDIRNGLAITRLDQSAATYEFSVYSFAQTHLVADVVGYFREPEATKLECVSLSSNSISGTRTLIVDSPSCPVGYAIVSGGCDTNGFINRDMTGNSVHHCSAWYSGAETIFLISHARCCRLPGR